MSAIALSPAQRRLNLLAVTAAMAVTALIYGLTVPLLSLVLHQRGVSSTLIGMSTAVQSLAIVVVAPLLPRLLGTIGPAPLMLGAVLVSLCTFLLLPVFDDVYAWFPLRFTIGAAGSCLWTCGEAWVNQLAQERTRGRVVAAYSMAVAGGFALGPLVLGATGSRGWLPFAVSAGIIALSALPLLAVAGIAPRLSGVPSARLPRFLQLAPVAMLQCLVFAMADGVLLTFLPLYGLSLGLGEVDSLSLITLLGLGGIACQLPVGWLADHVDRHLLAAAGVALVVLGACGMPLVLATPPWNGVYMFVFGGVLGGLYTLALVLLGERFRGADLASASALFAVMWGTGATIGPPLGGLAVRLFASHGVPVVLALMFLLYLPVPLLVRRRTAHEETLN